MVYNKTDWASHDVITTGKMNNIEDGIQTALNNSIFGHGGAEQPSEGTHITSYINLGEDFPKNALSGDVTYVRDGDDYVIYQYDGVSWVQQIDPKFSQRLEKTMLEAKAQTETLISENQISIDNTINQVKAEQENLQKGLDNLDTNAQEYANQALADAKADTAATAAELTQKVQKETDDRVKSVSDANAHADSIVATAKTDLTASIAKETSDRTAAVTALDTKAQGYATTAKNDAITTANATVAKEVVDRQKAITDLDKKTTDAVAAAKTDAQNAIDALQVGGRNYVLNSSGLSSTAQVRPILGGALSGTSTQASLNYRPDGLELVNNAANTTTEWYYQVANAWTNFSATQLSPGQQITYSVDVMGTAPQAVLRWGFNGGTGGGEYSKNFDINNTSWTRVSVTIKSSPTNTGFYIRLQGGINGQYRDGWTGGETLKFRYVKIEDGNMSTDWTAAPEDIRSDYVARDDKITQTFTQYTQTNDGAVHAAQSTATQALDGLSTKVSQTEYNTKTGDLDSKYTSVKQTVDTQTTDIADIKKTNTSQDSKINTIQSDVNGTKQSISDIQDTQASQTTKINTIQTSVDGTKQDIIDIKDANGVQDGKIASINTTVSGLDASFSAYKTTNDGKVNKAQADIIVNTNAINTKVSQTAYDTKTGQLQTDLNTTTATANQSKTDIVSIRSDNTKQDARMLSIESDANGTKTTVSNLQKDLNTASGSISTLQQTADGLTTTVSTLGSTNQLFNTEFSPDLQGWFVGDSTTTVKYDPSKMTLLQDDQGWNLGDGKRNGSNVLKKTFTGVTRSQFSSPLIPVGAGVAVSGSIEAQSNADYDGNVTARIDFRYYDGAMNYISSDTVSSAKISSWTRVAMANKITPANTTYVSFNLLTNGTTGAEYYSRPQLTFTSKLMDYTVGNYNNNGAVSKVQQTATEANTTIKNYQTSNDGRMVTAEGNITTNANAIKTKVSQTDYNQKTGQLQTDLNTTTNTANQSKTDIVSINQKNTAQDARMLSIESDANGTKTTVSNLQTDLGKANGSITTLQQRADGFDATVTKVNNLSVGGRNYVLNSSGLNSTQNARPTLSGTNSSGSVTYQADGVTLTNGATNKTTEWYYQVAGAWSNFSSTPLTAGNNFSFSADVMGTVPQVVMRWGFNGGTGGYESYKAFNINNTSWTRVSVTMASNVTNTGLYFRIQGAINNQYTTGWTGGETLKFRNVKIEDGNMATAWSPAPEDVNSSISVVKQTADEASTAIRNYQTSNDGRVLIAEGKITTNTNAITQKVSTVDYNANNNTVSTRIGKVETDVGTITSSVSEVTNKVNAMGQINQLFNTEFSPDFSGWYTGVSTSNAQFGKGTTIAVSNGWDLGWEKINGSNVIKKDLTKGSNAMYSEPIPVHPGSSLSASIWSKSADGTNSSVTAAIYLKYFDANGNYISDKAVNSDNHKVWVKTTLVDNSLPANVAFVIFNILTNGNTGINFYSQPMLAFSDIAGDYVSGAYNNNSKVAAQQITIDSISDVVSNPTTGLTKRVQTAEGTLSQVTGADIPALQKATYWQPYGSLDLNTYTKQGSFFFNTTSARTNNPTTATSWMYLMVEQGSADDSRVKQTAWYDGVTGVKITYVRTLNSGTWSPWYANDNDSVSTISQMNGTIQTEISNRATGDTNTLTQAKDFTTSSISNSESGMRSQITQTSDAIIAKIEATNLVTNSEFDPDNVGWYKLPADGSTIDVSGKVTTPIKSYYVDWDAVNGSRGMEFGATTGTWITSEPVRALSTGTYSISVLAGRPTATTTAVTMDFRLGLWDKDKKYITSVGGSNPLSGTTYLPLKFYKSENIAVPSNTAFVSFVLGHSGSGTPDAIYHPMINHGATISPYTPTYGTTASSTVLSLLKDNWSIGITGNEGKLASGVFGTIDGMNLVGNKMTINANQTTITGTTWIQTAMIGQGVINSAQISQLDVNKLVGNTSSFVKSSWDDAYGGTVSIDGNGMTIIFDGAYTKLNSGSLIMQTAYVDATSPGGKRKEWIGGLSAYSDPAVGNNVDKLALTLYDQTFPSYSDPSKRVGSPTNNPGNIWGGDKIVFEAMDTWTGHTKELFGWYNPTAAGASGVSKGFNFFDRVNFQGNEFEVSGAQNNLVFGWAQWSGYFSNEKSPAIIAANGSWRGGGLAFGNNNLVAYNAANGTNKILM